jgi:hypothetical protein
MKLLIGSLQIRVIRERTSSGTCETCHWFVESVETPSGKIGHCHRMAPTCGMSGQTYFAKMRGTQGCGQWMPPRNGGVR